MLGTWCVFPSPVWFEGNWTWLRWPEGALGNPAAHLSGQDWTSRCKALGGLVVTKPGPSQSALEQLLHPVGNPPALTGVGAAKDHRRVQIFKQM